MPKARGERGCCDRCAGATGAAAARAGAPGTAHAARIARRRLLKEALFQPPAGQAAGRLARGDFPDLSHLPRAVTGTVLDVSPHVLVLGEVDGRPGPERRLTLSSETTTWRGGPLEPTALRQGERAVVRLHPSRHTVADRIWAGIGRVTGTIIEHTSEYLVVNEGATRPLQIVVIPPGAACRIEVRFPILAPGYLIDVIGLRGSDALEGLIPATSQPAYPADRLPVPPLVSGHVPAAISGSATWHEPAGEPPGALGVAYPALDPEAGCAADAMASGGRDRGYARMPYLSVGSTLLVRNDCNGASCALPVTGCALVARLFNDRCVTCGTSPRGRVADLTEASFVALGGELDRGCFNATITMGR
ncbi:MAG: hypothetical protein ACRDNZ_14185 [Streptosporangiaceae bacterium]